MRGLRALRALASAVVVVLAAAQPALADSPPTAPAPPVLTETPVEGSRAPIPSVAGISSVVARTLKTRTLGSFSVVVADPATKEVLFERGGAVARIPASTIKILTATTALTVLGPQERLATRVVVAGDTLTLVGGGDSTLTREPKTGSASLRSLADRVAEQVQATTVTLQFDDSLFTGPELGPGWPRAFPAAGVVAPVSALMVDQGRTRPGARSRVADPARQAARVFAGFLRERGVTVSDVRAGAAPADATEIARVESPTVATLVQRMLTDSDNDLAEALAHLAGGKAMGKASFAGGAKAMSTVAADLGLDAGVIVDGSGLSGRDAVPASTLAGLLVDVTRQIDPATSTIGLGLPVAGFTGTLADRFAKGATQSAAGYVRAKTGTLTGVVSLAGTVKDVDGRVLVFAVLANGVRSLDGARRALDDFSSQLRRCGCS